jgi:hypothetical protein
VEAARDDLEYQLAHYRDLLNRATSETVRTMLENLIRETREKLEGLANGGT